MNRIITRLFAFILITSAFASAASAGETRVDFVGQVASSGSITAAPAGFALGFFQPGAPVIGWYSFENNPNFWSSSTVSPNITTNLSSGPLQGSFSLTFPNFSVVIDDDFWPFPMDSTLSVQRNGIYTVPNPDIPFPSLTHKLNFGQFIDFVAGGVHTLGSFRVNLEDPTQTALGSHLPPFSVDVNAFPVQDVSLNVVETLNNAPFTQLHDVGINLTIWAPSASSAATAGTQFAAFGAFEATNSVGGIAGWNVSGLGSATLTTLGDGSKAALLTAGSPVTLSQLIDTPSDPFELLFEYEFLSTGGTLTVLLDGRNIGSFLAPGVLVGGLTSLSLLVDNPLLLGQNALSLEFIFDGQTQSQLILDNVNAAVVVIPLPAAIALFASAITVLVGLGRRSPSANQKSYYM